MKDRENIIELYMKYESLLTKKQKNVFEKYFFEDLSLFEIAELIGISKSYVGKSIQRTIKKLKFYETKLCICKKNNLIISLIDNNNLKEKIKKIISG